MCLDDANQNIDALRILSPGGRQHRIGLADARRHAEKYLELAAALFGGKLKQRLRGGAPFIGGCGTRIGHAAYPAPPGSRTSSARFSLSTLIRYSPISPRKR